MAWIAVSEIATAHGKQQSITRITRSLAVVSVMASGATIAAPPVANQLPTGGQVSAGSAAIATSGNSMTVTQSSNRAAINWNTFDIGSAASVNFVQPSSQAIALNRVISSNPSQIYGQLSSNGQVYLINPSGVFFAPGSQVNVGGIVATTHQMSDAAFMAGSTTFERSGSTGKVINEGTIQTSLNGYIAMLAPEVRNSGLLLAQSGTVALAAAEKITLNFGPTSKLDSITVTAATLDTLVENRQAVRAPNGLIILSARSATQLAASVVNSGTLEAKGISQQGGRILLEGSTVNNTGTLDVSSDTAQAGTIQINGKNVALLGNVIATSPVQGGTLKVQASAVLNVNANINLGSAQRGGQVELIARQVSIADTVIDVDGDVQGGNVQVQATNAQNTNPFNDPFNPPNIPLTVALTGLTTINSRSRNGQGGNATILGDSISLDGNTTINVSGALGGGNVLVGGDWQGSNGTYQATTVYMGQNVNIDASATNNGNGGKVVLWSDIHNANSSTTVSGTILAKGGINSGDGGKVETSGYTLNADGIQINAGSSKGQNGFWLIDPYNYNIYANTASNIISALNNNTNVEITTESDVPSYGGTGAGIGYINLAAPITAVGSGGLTLRAADQVSINAAINISGPIAIYGTNILLNANMTTRSTGGGQITLRASGYIATQNTPGLAFSTNNSAILFAADTDGSGAGSIGLSVATLSTNGGDITLGGGDENASGYAQGINLNTVSNGSSAHRGIYLYSSALNAGGGNITLRGKGYQGANGASDSYSIGVDIVSHAFDSGTSNVIQTSGSGSMNINGIGGVTHTSGVNFWNDISSGTSLSTVNGSITITGTQGSGSGGLGGIHLQEGVTSIVSSRGNVNLVGIANATNNGISNFGTLNIGGNGSTNTTGNVTLSADNVYACGTYNIRNTGNFTIQSYNASFAAPYTWNTLFNLTGSTGLTIGKAGNLANVTVSNAVSIAGPIKIYGGNVVLNSSLTSSASGAAISLLASGNIVGNTAGITLSTNNGAVLLAADTDASNAGAIALDRTTITTSGGNITLGGGDLNASSYAVGTIVGNLSSGLIEAFVNYKGITLQNTALNAGGGNIVLRGKGSQVAAGSGNYPLGILMTSLAGLGTTGNTLSTTGSGTVSLTGVGGVNSDSSTFGSGIEFYSNTVGINKISTANGNITLTGTAGTGTASLFAGITASAGTVDLVSQQGNVTLQGVTGSSGGVYVNTGTTLNVGGNGTTNTTGNVTLSADSINSIGTTNFRNTGALTLEPYGASFTSVLNWPVTGLAIIGSKTALTLGKVGNTANIAIGSAINVDGSISMYGGNISLNAGLTTNNTSTGNVLLTGNVSGSNAISLSAGRSLTINQTGASTYGGVVSGVGSSLIKQGSGTLTLTGENTYNGTTNITAGSLQIGIGGTVGSVNGSSAINVSSGATVAFNRSDVLTIANAISGAGGVTITQNNNVNITGAASYTGNTSVGGGVLTFTNTNAPSTANFTGSGSILIQPSGTSFGAAQAVNYNIGTAFTGFTIGSTTNTANLTIGASSAINVGGAITLYGGNVTVNSTLSSNATADSLIYATNGNLLLNAGFNQTNGSGSTLTLKATGNVTQASTANIVGSGSATLGVIAWANSNNVSGQTNATVSLGNITTNNGSVWAGGALVPGNGTVLWRDMSVGQSGALISLNGNIAVGTGSVLLYEKTGNALTMGAPNLQISTATGGSIILVSDSFAANALTLNSDGYLYFLSNSNGANYSSTSGFNFNGTVSGNVFTGSNSLANIKIGHWGNSLTATSPGNLTGVSIGADGGIATPYYLDNVAGNVTVNADMLLPGFVQIHGNNVAINANVGAGSAVYGTLISAYGNVTQGANSKLYNYITLNGGTTGSVIATNVDNQITKLRANNLVDLNVVNNYTSAAMEVARISGLTGQINVRNAGNININGTIDTSSTANSSSSPALLIAAGYNQSVGTTNNNVTITGTQAVGVGSGGLGLIYTGSATNSGLTTLLGSGSGRYRYSTNLTSAGYNATAAALSSGLYALYRETPTLTISTANASIVYGNSSSTAMTTSALNGDTLADIFGNGSVPTATVSGNTSTAGFYTAGNHSVNISGPTTNLLGYATPTYSNGTMTVAKANLTIAGTAVANKAYDGSTNTTFTSNGTLTGVLSNGSVSDQVILTANGSFSSMNVGNNIAITMASTIGGSDADNYQLTAQPTVTANITPANITVMANNLSRAYGATNPSSGNVTLTSGSLYNGDTLSTANLTSNATTASNVGNYSLTANNVTMSSGLVSNYNIGYVNGTLTVTQANITVTANDLSRVYGAANPTSGAVTLTSGSLYNGDTLSTATLSSNALANSSVGSYGLAASNLTMSSGLVGNYNVSYANGTLTLTKASLGISANGTYSGSTTVLPGGFVITGLKNGETITGISSLTVNNANVAATTNGTQYITGIGASTGTADLSNYQLNASRNATLGANTTNVFTMARANLTVTPDNDAIFIGEALPSAASYAVSYAGFVGGQTASSLIAAGTLTAGNVTNSAGTAGNTSVPAGTYNLTAGSWSASNYAVGYANGTFTVSPADALLIQVGSKSMTYGTNLTSTNSFGTPTVRYMANGSPAVNLTLNASQSSGNHFVYDDGMTGSVAFNLTVANGSYSGSSNLKAGSGYQLTGANVMPTGPNLILTNGTTTTGALAVNALGVTASASNVSKVYDGTTSVNGLVINLSPSIISGDSVIAGGSGAFGSVNAGSNISYNVTGLALTGTDASNYVLSGGTSFSGSNGTITPRTVTLSANQVYSGSTVLTNVTIGNLVGSETLTYTANASSKNVQDNGTNFIANLLLGNGTNGGLSGNYQLPTLNVSNAPVTITRLNSVTWTGGSTGNWFDPANWAGGAVPDLNNVANVILPAGVTVSFNNTVVAPAQLGTVSIDSLTAGSANLSQTAGTLNVGLGGITLYSINLANGTLTSLGPINLASYIQSGGNLTASGNLTTQTYNQSGGLAMILGMLTTTNYTQSNGTTNVTGNLTATNYTQSNGTTNVQGNLLLTNFTQTGGLTTTSSNLTVNGSYAQTGGQVNVTGNANITTTSVMTLGNLTVGGTLSANSTSGNINQSAGSQMSVTGMASFLAPLGLITLNPGNNFAGGNSIIDRNGDRNKPSTADQWMYQYIMSQGGTTLYAPMPKTQTKSSAGTYKALAYNDQIILLDSQEQQSEVSEAASQTNQSSLNKSNDVEPIALNKFPEVSSKKAVEQNGKVFLVNTDLKPKSGENYTDFALTNPNKLVD